MGHRNSAVSERGLSEYNFDYCSPGEELGCTLPVLVYTERATGTYLTTTVSTKGASGKFTIEMGLEMIDEAGDATQMIVMKTDQEPNIKALIKGVRMEREEGRTGVEEQRQQRSGGTGRAEHRVPVADCGVDLRGEN